MNMEPKRHRKRLKQNDPLHFQDVVDRGDCQMKVLEQWSNQYTVKKLTNLALDHPDRPWSILRVQDGLLLYTFDRVSQEWVSDELEDAIVTGWRDDKLCYCTDCVRIREGREYD